MDLYTFYVYSNHADISFRMSGNASLQGLVLACTVLLYKISKYVKMKVLPSPMMLVSARQWKLRTFDPGGKHSKTCQIFTERDTSLHTRHESEELTSHH